MMKCDDIRGLEEETRGKMYEEANIWIKIIFVRWWYHRDNDVLQEDLMMISLYSTVLKIKMPEINLKKRELYRAVLWLKKYLKVVYYAGYGETRTVCASPFTNSFSVKKKFPLFKCATKDSWHKETS